MRTRTLLIILFMLVSAGCMLSTGICGQKAVVTESEMDGGAIRRVHDPNTGLVKKVTFRHGTGYVDGIKTDLWICKGPINAGDDPESPQDPECRQRISSSPLFGSINPDYGCGGWGCSFWP